MNDETIGMTDEQIEKFNLAERTISAWRANGIEASRLLHEARSGVIGVDWFDHRHHLLNPRDEFTDFWAESGCNVSRKIPLGGTVLDLCCGDGFYDYYFFRHRAQMILGIDINPGAIALARREHSAPNIEYVIGNVLDYEISGQYDVVICRGAIEHFTQDEQQAIFNKARIALVPGGWFCGDTVLPSVPNEAHKNEWKSKAEMDDALKVTFSNIDSDVIISTDRTTLLWRAQA